MKVVLYGQSGQVGEAILKKIKNDFEWQLPARTSPEGDFSCPEKLAAFLFQEKPDAVINAAAFTAVDEASRRFDEALTINATAPGIIARTCSQIGAYFISGGDSPLRPLVEIEAPQFFICNVVLGLRRRTRRLLHLFHAKVGKFLSGRLIPSNSSCPEIRYLAQSLLCHQWRKMGCSNKYDAQTDNE